MKYFYPYILLFITLFLSNDITSQNYQWDWAKNGGGTQALSNGSGLFTDYERVIDITVDSNNNYYYLMTYAGGNPTYDSNSLLFNDGIDMYIVSTDCDGNFRWDKEFGNQTFASGFSVQTDAANNVYVTGQANPRITTTATGTYWDTDFNLNSSLGRNDPGPHNRHAYLIKYNDQGVFQWIKFPDNGMLTRTEAVLGFNAGQMVVESNGTIHWLVSIGEGTHVGGNVTIPTGTDRQWMALRYDTNGVYLGQTNINVGGQFSSESYHFDYDPVLGIYYFAAFRINNFQMDYRGNSVGGNTFIVAIDEVTGNDLWYKDGANGSGTQIYDISVDNSNVYIAGSSQTSSSGTTSFAGYQFDQMLSGVGGGAQAGFVIALDSGGNLLWGNNSDTFTREGKTITVNGNEVALGYGLEMNDTWDGITVSYGVSQGEDPAVVRLNKTTGTTIAIEQIEGSAGQYDEVTALAVDNFGNYVVGGYMKNQLFLNDPNVPTITKNGGPADFFIARLAKTDCNGVPLSNEDVKKPQTSIYPNPSTDWISINSEQEFSSFSVYNVSGQQVLSNILSADQRLNISSLSNGIYFLKLEKDGQEIETLKLVKK